MFTGIIRLQGRVAAVDLKRGKFKIEAPRLLRQLRIGDSISVDGICLTVTTKEYGLLAVDITPETIRRTNLRWTRPQWLVNLEPPMRLGDRIHGHIVLGHVDGVGYVRTAGRYLSVWIPPKLVPYMAEKGSVTVNGVSLTIARHRGRLIQIALIPETLRRTNLRFLKTGSYVNLEVDVLARYAVGKGMKTNKIWKQNSVRPLKRR